MNDDYKWADQAAELFGEEHWKLCISRLFDVNKRTVQRWNAGLLDIPEALAVKIDKIWKVKYDNQI